MQNYNLREKPGIKENRKSHLNISKTNYQTKSLNWRNTFRVRIPEKFDKSDKNT